MNPSNEDRDDDVSLPVIASTESVRSSVATPSPTPQASTSTVCMMSSNVLRTDRSEGRLCFMVQVNVKVEVHEENAASVGEELDSARSLASTDGPPMRAAYDVAAASGTDNLDDTVDLDVTLNFSDLSRRADDTVAQPPQQQQQQQDVPVRTQAATFKTERNVFGAGYTSDHSQSSK